MTKVIIIEKGKEPYFKDIDLSKYDNNMNLYAEKEIDCFAVDRIYILPNYELTIYVDDNNMNRPNEELNFFVQGNYLLPVKGKAIISRARAYLDEIEYEDVTEKDLNLFLSQINRVK